MNKWCIICRPKCYLLFLLFFCVNNNDLHAQVGTYDTLVMNAVIYEGDTIPAKYLEQVYVHGITTELNMSEAAKRNRLRNAVYVTYPYARRAAAVLNSINDYLVNVTDKSERKKYIHSREKELKKEFTDPLTNLSIYQGKVLMKLINRETGNNCYEIIKEYKGGLAAGFYQTVAFFFSTSLKQPYDAQGEDALAESFVMEVQRMYGFSNSRISVMNTP
jgi:Domain of unknown function (DUF4294)